MNMESVKDTKENYDDKAKNNNNEVEREQKPTYQVLCFNNWIKSVLINVYTKQMCRTLQNILDIRKGGYHPLLHVLDIGCGRGQDIKKWRNSRVKYMMAVDFSDECIKVYQDRWRKLNQPFRLQTLCADFCSQTFYYNIGHTYYDIVSAQLCFHYMFQTKTGLQTGLASILSNLLVDGVFIATIPDSYTIIKKVEEKGVKENGYTTYGNSYFSIRFAQTDFKEPYGNQYGFYLQDSVGEKNPETGEIAYTNQYLIQLDNLNKMLNKHGVKIQYTENFIEFYKKYKDQYKDLLCRIFNKINYEPGQSMNKQLWEIAHLYRVLVCRKFSTGKPLSQFRMDDRIKSIKGKQLKKRQFSGHGQNNHHQNWQNRNKDKHHYHHSNHHHQRK